LSDKLDALYIEPKHLEIVQSILKKYKDKQSKVYVFGSRSTGKVKKYSGLDLAFDLKNNSSLSLAFLADLKEDFDSSGLPYRVDIVDLNAVDSEFKKIIMSQAKIIDY
jgi:predicted nucleotidyltransferase